MCKDLSYEFCIYQFICSHIIPVGPTLLFLFYRCQTRDREATEQSNIGQLLSFQSLYDNGRLIFLPESRNLEYPTRQQDLVQWTRSRGRKWLLIEMPQETKKERKQNISWLSFPPTLQFLANFSHWMNLPTIQKGKELGKMSNTHQKRRTVDTSESKQEICQHIFTQEICHTLLLNISYWQKFSHMSPLSFK